MKILTLSVVLVSGILSPLLAASAGDYPPVSFVVPGGSNTTIDKSKYLVLVVEPGFISHENQPIAADAVAAYINTTLKDRGATMLAVHIRQGITFGDVVQALELMRKTEAKSIGVSMIELPTGKEL